MNIIITRLLLIKASCKILYYYIKTLVSIFLSLKFFTYKYFKSRNIL